LNAANRIKAYNSPPFGDFPAKYESIRLINCPLMSISTHSLYLFIEVVKHFAPENP